MGKKDVQTNFASSLTEEEKHISYHLKLRKKDGEIDIEFLYDLLMRVTKMTGMKFSFAERSTTSFSENFSLAEEHSTKSFSQNFSLAEPFDDQIWIK